MKRFDFLVPIPPTTSAVVYRALVAGTLHAKYPEVLGRTADAFACRIEFLTPPGKQRDLDAMATTLLEALVKAGVMRDDAAIETLILSRSSDGPAGSARVTLLELDPMTKNAVAKTFSLFPWANKTLSSAPEAPPPGDAPSLTLTPGTTTMGITAAATPGTGRTIIDWEVQRLISGVWTTIALPPYLRADYTPAKSTRTPTKYVHPSGTLAGNSAYTTLQAAADAAVAGDEIVIGAGTYTGKLICSTPGTSTNPIRFRPYDYDNKPAIDASAIGTSYTGAIGSSSIIAVQASYVIVDGIDITGVQASGSGHAITIGRCDNNGSFVQDTQLTTWFVGIGIYRCKVTDVKGQGLIAMMTDDCTIAGNDFSGCQKGAFWDTSAGNPSGYGNAVSLCGRNMKFLSNKVRQTMGEGIHVGQHINMMQSGSSTPQGLACNDFEIRGNTFYDCWAPPMYLTVASGGVVEENLVFMSDNARFWFGRNSGGSPLYGILVGCELGAFSNPSTAFDTTWPGVEDVDIRNNILCGGQEILKFATYGGADKHRNIRAEHNTVFKPRGSGVPASIYNNNVAGASDDMSGFTIRRNAILADSSGALAPTWNALGSGKTVGGNLFSHTAPIDLSGTGDIVNGGTTVLADKSYVAPNTDYPTDIAFDLTKAYPYYSGGTISPLVNAADSISVVKDFFGNTRPTSSGKVDIGAISLSRAGVQALTETGLSPSTAYDFRARFRMDDLTWSSYCSTVTGTTSAGSGGTEVAPGIRGFTTATSNATGSGSTTVTVSKPSGVAAGDELRLWASLGNNSGSTWGAVTWPSGFTQDAAVDAGAGGYNKVVSARKTAGGSEPATYDVTYAEAGGPYRVGVVMGAFSAPNATPMDVAATTSYTATDATSVLAPSITPSNANEKRLVCAWVIGDGNQAVGTENLAPPGGMTEHAEVASSSSPYSRLMVASQVYASASATGTRAADIGTPFGKKCLGVTVLLRGKVP